ncbi:MAG: hypothetical protein M1292_09895 [Bacteroidetes bacterium]|nr:hypothetical protein [Bacteroidota bacterium]
MNILTEIIDQLIDSKNSITDSLLKVKVLASRLKNKTLYNWVDRELSGYESLDQVPEYRITGCILIGNIMNGNWQLKNQVIATIDLPDFIKRHVEIIKFNQAISVLERYLIENQNPLSYAIPAETLGYLTENYQRMGNPYATVYSARKQVDLGVIQHAISEVRNKALDLLLKLEEEFGVEIELQELIKKKTHVNEIINNIMKQTIITKGDGNVINTGSENTIKIKVRIENQNFEELSKALRENHVQENEIETLKQIIGEEPDYNKKLFGPKVNNWIQKMTNKALNGTWQVGIGAAGTILAELLKQYYGM